MTDQTHLAPADIADRQREVTALIESMAVSSPELHARLTVAAVMHFLKLPDKSFGWIDDGAMPLAAKFLVVATTLKLGLTPGLGQIYFLGNKLYVSAEGLRAIAGSSPDFKFTGARVVRALSADEKLIFDIAEMDRALVIEQGICVKGETFKVVGYGIIGADELQKKKPGMDSKKNIAMTLLTRAERDIYRRFLPLHGVTPSDETEKEDAMPTIETRATTLPSIHAASVDIPNAGYLLKANQALVTEIRRLEGLGASPALIRDRMKMSVTDALLLQNAEAVFNLVDVLRDTPVPPKEVRKRAPKATVAESLADPQPSPTFPGWSAVFDGSPERVEAVEQMLHANKVDETLWDEITRQLKGRPYAHLKDILTELKDERTIGTHS